MEFYTNTELNEISKMLKSLNPNSKCLLTFQIATMVLSFHFTHIILLII